MELDNLDHLAALTVHPAPVDQWKTRSTADSGFRFLEGFSRLLSMVSMVALASFLVASSPARFSVSLVGTSFFLVEETVGVLETKEEGFLAEEMLPCSLDSSWRKLSGLGRNVYTHLRPNLIVD